MYALSLSSCIDEDKKACIIDETEIAVLDRLTSKSSEPAIVYDTLPNPYSLNVMQEVYDIYSESEVTLSATDLYVKFMPKDSIQLQKLISDYQLELFEYPLDIELIEGVEYVNQNLPSTDLVWLYTTVPADFMFPDDVAYEIIDQCYIPEEDEIIGTVTKAGIVSVEDAAFELLGYDLGADVSARIMGVPQGAIKVMDDMNNFVPVKGVKVRCHIFVKWATAYTDENGYYLMNKSFLLRPYYSVVFSNLKDFDVWDNWGPITCATYNMGRQSKYGYSENIHRSSSAWVCAAVNNASYDYYKMCEQTGILKPPSALKIWIWSGFSASSAPMLRRINDAIGYNGHSSVANFFINVFGYGAAATFLTQALRIFLPDITIGSDNADYERIYYKVNHELAHSSHFSKAGSSFWAKYISYIMTYGAYGGNDSGRNAQLCAIGEMWGFFMGYIQVSEIFNRYLGIPLNVDGWIYPNVFWDLCTTDVLSKKQIFDCLKPDVDTYDELVTELYTLYPEQAVDIYTIFRKYPQINLTVTPPEVNGVMYDAFCYNQDVISSMSVSGDNVLVQNSTVRECANLTIDANTSITINKPFVVEKGASLIIR